MKISYAIAPMRMTLTDAREKCLQYEYLIGKTYKEDEIDQLIIVPADAEPNSEIIFRAAQNMPYDDLLDGHADFTLLALLNLHDYPFNSNLYWRYLDEILKERP